MPLLDREIDEDQLLSLLSEFRKRGANSVVIEKQHVMQGQGLSSSGKTMEQYGFIKGLCKALGYEIALVSAQSWQAHYKTLVPEEFPEWIEKWNLKPTKKKSIYICSVMFPDISLLRSKRSKKPSDGLSDALLIGNYWVAQQNLVKVSPIPAKTRKAKNTSTRKRSA